MLLRASDLHCLVPLLEHPDQKDGNRLYLVNIKNFILTIVDIYSINALELGFILKSYDIS